jgi:hypothetical protein
MKRLFQAIAEWFKWLFERIFDGPWGWLKRRKDKDDVPPR